MDILSESNNDNINNSINENNILVVNAISTPRSMINHF